VPTKLYEELGGFDELYAPAYYEDTDLALRIRAQGKSVIYQPLSEVVHFEGISSGTDTSTGIKAYQVINREKFLQRWKSRLQQHRPNGVEPHLERDRGAKGRVLFIDACTPTPDQDSGSIDIYNLMKVFVEMGWAVSFIPEDNYAYMEKYTPAIQKLGVQALYHPHINSVDDHITPYGSSYDLVMSFRPMVTHRHIDNLRQKCPGAKIVYNTVDLHFLRLDREAKVKNDHAIAQEGLRLKAIELDLMTRADLTTVVSSSELETLQSMGVERVVHLPFSREIRPSNVPFEARSGIIFVGGFQHNPNVDAVLYFVTDIMPILREMIPGIIFNIVGSKAPKEIESTACEDIVFHGYIEDLEAMMEGVRVNVAPLRYGAGTKGKVIHAMSNGIPTVATPIAAEGMNLKHMDEILLASDPASFAEMIKEVYKNEHLWSKLSSQGLMSADRLFGLSMIREKVKRFGDVKM
jgi:glycosyltransferase involved in cell wall biosynthesis